MTTTPLLKAIHKIAHLPEFTGTNKAAAEKFLRCFSARMRGDIEEEEAMREELKAAPSLRAIARVAFALGEVKWHRDVAGNAPVEELCQALQSCLFFVSLSDDPMKAFTDLFAGSHLRILNRERALGRHAGKKEILESRWRSYKQGGDGSIPKAAATYAKHYAGEVTERAFLDYFRAQAKAEGMARMPGRPRKTSRK